MKKSLIALAVLAASGAAMAQSSVTLYGVADAAVTHVNGKDNWTGLSSGANKTSRLGFRGVEDLGGGLKANFVLEGGFNLDAGDGKSSGATDSGFQFKRQSTVGLAGNFGEVRLGRELTAAYNATARYDVFGSVGIAHSQLWDDGKSLAFSTAPATLGKPVDPYHYTTNQRVSNAITYVSPDFSGFKVAANYGFGEVAGKNRDGRYFGGGLTYDNGPLSLGLGAERLNKGDGAAMQAQASNDITAWSLGGSYDLGVAKLLAAYRQSTAKDVAILGATSDLKNRGYMLAVTAPVGPGLVRAAYNRYEAKFDREKGVTDQFGLGYVYNLSKRTSVYGTYAYIKNKNKNGNALNLTVNSSSGVKSNGSQQAVQVGVTHAF
ncbi:MAG TPA: porin [Acidovorax temperans]|nr:porin [Acidovorax temperans]